MTRTIINSNGPISGVTVEILVPAAVSAASTCRLVRGRWHPSAGAGALSANNLRLTTALRLTGSLGVSIEQLTDRIYWTPGQVLRGIEQRRPVERLSGSFRFYPATSWPLRRHRRRRSTIAQRRPRSSEQTSAMLARRLGRGLQQRTRSAARHRLGRPLGLRHSGCRRQPLHRLCPPASDRLQPVRPARTDADAHPRAQRHRLGRLPSKTPSLWTSTTKGSCVSPLAPT